MFAVSAGITPDICKDVWERKEANEGADGGKTTKREGERENA